MLFLYSQSESAENGAICKGYGVAVKVNRSVDCKRGYGAVAGKRPYRTRLNCNHGVVFHLRAAGSIGNNIHAARKIGAAFKRHIKG